MRSRLFPVIATASITSIVTLFAASRLMTSNNGFLIPETNKSLSVSHVNYSGPVSAAPPASFEMAAESSVKAVVHIKTATQAKIITDNSMGDIFSQLFGQRQYYIPSQQGSGSGVVISPDGYIVTNNHVVADASDVTVTFNDRYTAKAKVVGTDPSTDIAVLKVEGDEEMHFMEFGNSDDVKLGQWVLAVGFPLNLDATVTAGIVSAKGRSLGVNKQRSAAAIESFIQTDAAVNPGNSGGALVNTTGQLVGINSAIASPTGSYAGYSYAIPANIVRKVVNDLMKYGAVQRAYMGVEYLDSRSASPEDLSRVGLDKTDGVYITDVRPNSGAAKAGLRKGDFITHINGAPVNNQADIQGQIARFRPGDNINVMYNRGGKSLSASVLLTNLNGTTDILKGNASGRLLGASFRPVTASEKASYGIDRGIVVTDPGTGSFAKQTQMQKGFVITAINNSPVGSVADLQQILSGSGNVQIAGFYPGIQGMYYYGLNNKGSQ
ncbi:MAG: trypsin-like peptidase domain-containing protein [Flavipsychrobacter sp.]|nr:trypsin-like peptidase domain-containing protein [Flavipsychrobacter sp.]